MSNFLAQLSNDFEALLFHDILAILYYQSDQTWSGTYLLVLIRTIQVRIEYYIEWKSWSELEMSDISTMKEKQSRVRTSNGS